MTDIQLDDFKDCGKVYFLWKGMYPDDSVTIDWLQEIISQVITWNRLEFMILFSSQLEDSQEPSIKQSRDNATEYLTQLKIDLASKFNEYKEYEVTIALLE